MRPITVTFTKTYDKAIPLSKDEIKACKVYKAFIDRLSKGKGRFIQLPEGFKTGWDWRKRKSKIDKVYLSLYVTEKGRYEQCWLDFLTYEFKPHFYIHNGASGQLYIRKRPAEQREINMWRIINDQIKVPSGREPKRHVSHGR